MKVTPQPTHGRPSYWVAKSVGSQFSVCGPVFAGIRSEDEFRPGEIIEATPAARGKKDRRHLEIRTLQQANG